MSIMSLLGCHRRYCATNVVVVLRPQIEEGAERRVLSLRHELEEQLARKLDIRTFLTSRYVFTNKRGGSQVVDDQGRADLFLH